MKVFIYKAGELVKAIEIFKEDEFDNIVNSFQNKKDHISMVNMVFKPGTDAFALANMDENLHQIESISISTL